MMTRYIFGPYFGLPDGSPFVMKGMMLLKLAGLPYKEDRGGYQMAPKGKLPFIADGPGTPQPCRDRAPRGARPRCGRDFAW
jgi:hypothetical protein